ncbi:MAG: CarD family transcriptional regulator, partial [Iodobacter sp.]
MTLPALPPLGQRTQIAGLHGSGDAWALSQYAKISRPLVVFTSSAQVAGRLKEEIAFLAPEKNIVLFPDWETLAYDHFSPHSDLISERLAALWQIRQNQAEVVIVPVQTAMGILPPVEYLAAYTFFLKKGERIDADQLRADMAFAGYSHVTQVYGPGEFSIRGGLIDLFPMGSTLPFRIDLFGDEIETIRTFDVDTQRSLYPVPEIRLLPAREFPLDEKGRTQFRQRFREVFEGDPTKARIYKEIGSGGTPAGIEYYLPLFFEQTATLFDYLPKDAVLALHGELLQAAEQFWAETQDRYRNLSGDKERPILPPKVLYLSPDALFAGLKKHRRLEFIDGENTLTAALPALNVDRRAENPLLKLTDFIASHPGRILLCAESLGRRETMAQFFAEYGLKPTLIEGWEEIVKSKDKVLLTAAPFYNGFVLNDSKLKKPLAIITEANLYAMVAQSRGKRQQKRSNTDAMLRDLSELKIGDAVVHEGHGIGRYSGLTSMDLGEGETE